MSVFVITILDQRRIDRSPMPASLVSFYSNEEWNNFCNKVDRVLTELDNSNGLKGKECVILTVVLGALIPLYIFVGRPFVGFGLIADVICALTAMSLVTGYIKWAKDRAIAAIWRKVDGILVEESKRKERVSFHLKTEKSQEMSADSYRVRIYHSYTQYIECQVAPAAFIPVAFDTFQDNNHSIGEEAKSNVNDSRSVKQRLAELEDVKEMLSEQEYEEQKRAILSCL